MYAGRVRSEHIGTTITLKGWVSRRRNLGGLIFIDLRDREGLMQLVVNPENADAAVVETAESLRSEFVIEVTGTVEAREQVLSNLKLKILKSLILPKQRHLKLKMVLRLVMIHVCVTATWIFVVQRCWKTLSSVQR